MVPPARFQRATSRLEADPLCMKPADENELALAPSVLTRYKRFPLSSNECMNESSGSVCCVVLPLIALTRGEVADRFCADKQRSRIDRVIARTVHRIGLHLNCEKFPPLR